MKIELKDFITKDLKRFNLSLSDIDGIFLDGDVHINGSVSKVENEYIVEGSYSANIKSSCVRCLEDIVIKLEKKKFYGIFLKEEDYFNYQKSLSEKDIMISDNYFEIKNEEIDILEFIREQIILDIPLYPKCNGGCLDDTYLKKYGEDQPDPRWMGLLDIEIKN